MTTDDARAEGARRRRGVVGRLLRIAGLGLAALLVAVVSFHGPLIDLFAGHSARRALRADASLSDAARALVERCAEGLEPARLVDLHTHLAGRGAGSDCWVNPRMRSLAHPRDWIRMRSYLSAAGLAGEAPDGAFVDDLLALSRASPIPTRHLLLPFDHRYEPGGALDLERSEFHVPNDYVLAAVDASPDRFLAAASVHPYRPDAIAELERVAARGARFVKWLPNAQGIDPASARCDAFYSAMRRLGLMLLTHTGEEQAVDAAEEQELGNPLRLRRPLDAGVVVVAAHCASSGDGIDLDDPARPRVPNHRLFLRLMDEPRYAGRLFGEISTTTQINRYRTGLAALLERPDLHARLVNGSDWPLPAVNVLYSTRALQRAGFLTAEERAALNELYHWNPLTFDLCLKRTVRSPRTGDRFDPEAFLVPAEWQLR